MQRPEFFISLRLGGPLFQRTDLINGEADYRGDKENVGADFVNEFVHRTSGLGWRDWFGVCLCHQRRRGGEHSGWVQVGHLWFAMPTRPMPMTLPMSPVKPSPIVS